MLKIYINNINNKNNNKSSYESKTYLQLVAIIYIVL